MTAYTKLILIGDGSCTGEKDNGLIVHWQTRLVQPGHVSLPQQVDQWLPEIRKTHAAWAYETGFLPIQPGLTLQEIFKCGSRLSMWWTSLLYERHPRLSPHLYSIYKLICLERIARENNCAILDLYGGDRLLRTVLGSYCKKAGIELNIRGSQSEEVATSLPRRLYQATPAPLRTLVRYAHWWWTIRRRLPFNKKPFPAETADSGLPPATICVYYPNIDLHEAAGGRYRSRYLESLHEALNARARYEKPAGPNFTRWLFIRFPSPQLSLLQCIKLRDLFRKNGEDGQSFNYLEEFVAHKDLWHAWLRWLRLVFQSARAQKKFAATCCFTGSDINFWPYAQEEWAESFRGWRCLERCLQNLAFIRYFQMAGDQRWTMFPLENCPWERMLCVASRENGKTPIFGGQHSTIRPTDFRYFDDPRTFSETECAIFQPDVIAGNGQSACGQWLAFGVPPERMKMVEALRYLYLAAHVMTQDVQTNLPPEPGEPLEPPASKKLLVLTSFFENETNAHLNLLKLALEAGLLHDWQITIKPHPYLPVGDWLDSIDAALKKNIIVVDTPLSTLMRPGMAVWAANSTTASLEAAMLKLPLMVMLPDNDFDLCPIQDAPGLLRTGTVEDVKNGLENLAPPTLGPDYLDLDSALPAWRKLLGLNFPTA